MGFPGIVNGVWIPINVPCITGVELDIIFIPLFIPGIELDNPPIGIPLFVGIPPMGTPSIPVFDIPPIGIPLFVGIPPMGTPPIGTPVFDNVPGFDIVPRFDLIPGFDIVPVLDDIPGLSIIPRPVFGIIEPGIGPMEFGIIVGLDLVPGIVPVFGRDSP